MSIEQEIKDIKRFRQILKILSEEGFSFLIEYLELKHMLPIGTKKKKTTVSNEVRLRRTLERLGPTFIKLGQMLSVRPDFVPKHYIHELEKLQDRVAPFSFAAVKKQFAKNGKSISEIFSSFTEKPIASASISQVHKAVLKDGRTVAVKVKRPQIEEIIEEDLEIMQFIATLAEERVKGLAKYRPKGVVEEFSRWTKKELDFRIEAENMHVFHENFLHSTTTKIPEAYYEFCDQDIIVMEYIKGKELSKLKQSPDNKEAVKNGFYSVLEQVFVHGFFHADPHPSNILVLPDNKVSFVDFGIVGRFNNHLKEYATDLFLAVTEGDTDAIVDLLLELGETREEIDIPLFHEKINDLVFLFKDSSLNMIKISTVLEEILDTALDFGVRIPREFVLFGKAVVTIEGIGLLYSPDFKFVESAQPFMEEIIVARYDPSRVAKESFLQMMNLKKSLTKIPKQTTRVLDKLEKGKIKIEMRDTDIERLSVNLDKSSNRLSYGMIIAALLISGSLLIEVGDTLAFGFSFISTLLFSFAIFIGFMLVVSIMREQR